MSSSCLAALCIVSFARIILIATIGLLPSVFWRNLSYADTTLEKTPFPLAFNTSYLHANSPLVVHKSLAHVYKYNTFEQKCYV
jgi:hypothetical protein